MVTEPIRITGASGVASASVVTQTLTGGISEVPFQTLRVVTEDQGFTALAASSFRDDWESSEDAIFDSLLKDAQSAP